MEHACQLQPTIWRKPGLLHMCTRGEQHKAQEENGLISGLKDYRYLSVMEECNMKTVGGAQTKGSSSPTARSKRSASTMR